MGGNENFQYDMRQAGWKLVGNEKCFSPLFPHQIEIVSFANGGSYEAIEGKKMIHAAKKIKACYGQHQAEFLLKYQEEMPGEWHFYSLVFPGTEWKDREGVVYVPALKFEVDWWWLDFERLDIMFQTFRNRLIRKIVKG